MRRISTVQNIFSLVAGACLLGCTISDSGVASDDGNQGGDQGGNQGGEGGDVTAKPPEPPAEPSVGDAALARLSNTELRNTLTDLFGAGAVEGLDLQQDVEGSVRTLILAVEASEILSRAEIIADRVYNAPKVMICQPEDAADRRNCTEKIVRDLGQRMFRRPLVEAEFTRFVGVAMAAATFEDGISTVVFGMLASPKFLYHVNRGEADQRRGDVQPLDDYEMASRLSYSLWQTMPTSALFDAAAAGRLTEIDDIRQQALGMLGDGRARITVRNFHNWWLHLAEAESVFRDQSAYPSFTDQLPRTWVDQTQNFAEYVTFDGEGSLVELFTAPYLIDGDMKRVEQPADQRAGLLTHPAILAAHAPDERLASIQRGAFIYRSVLCQPVPPPPDNVPPLPSPDPTKSVRNQIVEATSNATCKVCHKNFNNLGFALGNYDAIGDWKTQDDNGKEVDAAVTLNGPFDLKDAKISGPIALASTLAKSEALRDCYVDSWFKYLLGRDVDVDADEYSRLKTQYEFEVDGRSIQTMLVEMMASDALRYVRAPD